MCQYLLYLDESNKYKNTYLSCLYRVFSKKYYYSG